MRLGFQFLLVAVLTSPLTVAADVMHYSHCKLIDGKTIADAQAWQDDWRQLIEREGINYKSRILVPHASPDGSGEFILEGSSSTLSTYGAAWEWWYSDSAAAASGAQFEAAATCDAGSVYITND